MLHFTAEQQNFVLANRRAFNATQADLAARIGGENAGLMGNALSLPKDVWGLWDKEGLLVQRSKLAVFADLAASVSAPHPMGKLVKYFQQISNSGGATVSLDGRASIRSDKPTMTYIGTPVPVILDGFEFGWREVMAAQSEGVSLDTNAMLNSQRYVSEALESGVLNGYSTITVNGSASYGLRNHPKRNTRSTGVTLNAATGAQWVSEVVATLKLLHADNYKTPATIYLNWSDWFYASSNEFTAGYPKTILQRVVELGGIRDIVPADSVNANEIIAVVKDRAVVQILNAMPVVTNPMMRANPQDNYQFLTMAAAAIEIKYDASDNCGIAHSS
jgi:Family of unknown function (DUF6260)